MQRKKIIVLLASNGQGAGKSTLAGLLQHASSQWNMEAQMGDMVVLGISSFARPLKETLMYFLTSICGLSKEAANEHLWGSLKNAQLPGFPEGVTARKMMQQLGTEFRENIGDPQLWRRLMVKKLNVALDWQSHHRVVVIDDWRFIGELDYLKENLWGDVKLYTVFVQGKNVAGQGTHVSEGEITPEMCDCVIENPQMMEPFATIAKELLERVIALD